MNDKILKESKVKIIGLNNEAIDSDKVVLNKVWENNICKSSLKNNSRQGIKIKELILFTGKLDLPKDTYLYGEGYNKLAQYGGTLGKPEDIGSLSDRAHYKMPQKEGFWTVYNLALLSPPKENLILMAFSSCNRFSGEFRFKNDEFEIALDTEGLELMPGEEWELEEFFIV